MVPNPGLLGLAIVLTLAAGLGHAYYESFATRRGLQHRGFRRPGAAAVLFGVGTTALITGQLSGNWFIPVAGALASLSGLHALRQGGRLMSFAVLWISAIAVVVVLGTSIPAFGADWADVSFTAFVLACFCGLLRELDATGSIGWFSGLVAAAATTVMCAVVDRSHDASLALLVAGGIFGIIAAAPFGAGLLGRIGARFAGLVIGGIAIRAAAGHPNVMLAVVATGVVCAFGFVLTLERPYRGRTLIGVVAVAAALGVAALPAVLALRDVYKPLRSAVAQSRALVKTPADQDLSITSVRLGSVKRMFRASEAKLTAPQVRIGRVVPFLGSNLRAATASAGAAADLADSAQQLVERVTVRSLSFRHATVAQADLDRLGDGLRGVQAAVKGARRNVNGGGGTDLLVPELRDGVHDLRNQIDSVDRRVRVFLDGATATKRLLGYDRPRRYFVAVQNNAESRATGGYIANYGILVARNGHVELPQFRRTSEFDAPGAPARSLSAPNNYTRRYSRFDVTRTWPNVNMSPGFPTVAEVMADQYEQFSGLRVDGVLAVDPIALARLITLTGPQRVAGWPVAINSANAVQILLHDEYVAFENNSDQRIDFLGRVAKQVFDQLADSGFADLAKAGSVVHQITERRHIQFWVTDEPAQHFFNEAHIDGAVPPLQGDALLVTTQNAAANKADFYLKRVLKYEATVRRAGDGLHVDATVTVTLQNTAPSAGEPRYVIGPADDRFRPGQNLTYLTIYSPFKKRSASLDGKPLVVDGAPEFNRVAYSAFVDIPSGATKTVELHLSGEVTGSQRFVVDVVRQPVVVDDQLEILVHGAGNGRQFRLAGSLTKNLHFVLPVEE